ncbi:MAG: riboflavin kinase [Rikenellaceae bacterium]
MYLISGIVESGRKLGRTLGFPTANIALDPSQRTPIGVYVSRVEIEGVWHAAVTNVGTNPTVGGNSLRSESYIFDFEGDLYGCTIRIELQKMIRGEMKFGSVEALRKQIELDVATARNYSSKM